MASSPKSAGKGGGKVSDPDPAPVTAEATPVEPLASREIVITVTGAVDVVATIRIEGAVGTALDGKFHIEAENAGDGSTLNLTGRTSITVPARDEIDHVDQRLGPHAEGTATAAGFVQKSGE
jgi:hypothetical protein